MHVDGNRDRNSQGQEDSESISSSQKDSLMDPIHRNGTTGTAAGDRGSLQLSCGE